MSLIPFCSTLEQCLLHPHIFDSRGFTGIPTKMRWILSLKSNEYFWNKGSNTPSYQNALSPCGRVMTIIIIIIISSEVEQLTLVNDTRVSYGLTTLGEWDAWCDWEKCREMCGSGQYLAGPYITLQHTLAVMSLCWLKRKKLSEPGKPSMQHGIWGLLIQFILHVFACEWCGIQADGD